MKYVIIGCIMSLAFARVCHAQGSIKDDGLRMSLFQFQVGFHQPFGDMAELYGSNAQVGFSYAYKSAKNILLGVDMGFLFSDNVNNSGLLLQELRNSSGNIVGLEGQAVVALILQRGYSAGFYTGKIFPVFGPNPNSGLVIKVGLEYFEHRTWIETRQDEYPPLEDEYRKGYDRKRAGLAIHEFIGYQHFGNNRFANFFAGFDFYQAFTTDYRSYNIDQMSYTNGEYFDMLVGVKFGWVFPVYRQKAEKFYVD